MKPSWYTDPRSVSSSSLQEGYVLRGRKKRKVSTLPLLDSVTTSLLGVLPSSWDPRTQ